MNAIWPVPLVLGGFDVDVTAEFFEPLPDRELSAWEGEQPGRIG